MVVLNNIKAFVAGINPVISPIAAPLGAEISGQTFSHYSLSMTQERRCFCPHTLDLDDIVTAALDFVRANSYAYEVALEKFY